MKKFDDCYILNNGMSLPCQGFGADNPRRGGDNVGAIKEAIAAGYRFIDTASLYETERAVGQAVKESGIPREEFIIETKVWIDELGYENVKEAFARSLERLQMNYVDIYMMHWPRQTGAFDEDWKTLDIESWRAMEELVEEGKVRALGCSNFLPHHLENLLANCKIKPVVDQLELHPGYSQEAAVAYCLEHDIRPMAWSPMGRGQASTFKETKILADMAQKYQKSIAQICLRFLHQKGIILIPKSGSLEHMKENMDIYNFELSTEDMWILTCMPQTTWLGEHPDFVIPQRGCRRDQ